MQQRANILLLLNKLFIFKDLDKSGKEQSQMKVFYYYYYIFYKAVWDTQPDVSATLGLTALEGFFLIAVFDIAFARFFCFDFNKYYMIGVLAILLLLNTFYFFTSKKVKAIVKAQPKFFNSHRSTIVFVLVFSLIVISTLFWTGDYVNEILDQCRP
jgi:hypothetical protein